MTSQTKSLFDHYIKPIKAASIHAIQREAVRKYLLQYGEINRDWAYMTGLPECGRIKNLGARVLDLRKQGWRIQTLENPTRYRLISAHN